MLKACYSKIFEKAKKTLTFLFLDNLKQDEEIPEVADFSDSMTLKVADDMLQGFCHIKPSNFNGHEKFVASFIDEKMRLIDLANFSCNCHKRYYLSISRQMSDRWNKFICLNELMG